MKKTSSAKQQKEIKTIDERVEALTKTLPDSERKLAELLTARQMLLATHSASELAAMTGSSKAAVSRFIQRIGYRSFADARRETREAQCWGITGLSACTGFVRRHRGGVRQSFAARPRKHHAHPSSA